MALGLLDDEGAAETVRLRMLSQNEKNAAIFDECQALYAAAQTEVTPEAQRLFDRFQAGHRESMRLARLMYELYGVDPDEAFEATAREAGIDPKDIIQ
jgi:hypothetical protein